MTLTKQQKFILEIIRNLGCVKREQLLKLYMAHALLPEEQAARQLDAMLRQLRNCVGELRVEDDWTRIDRIPPDLHRLEAIDVMLELTGGVAPLCKARLPPPLLLRFALGGEAGAVFVVIRYEDMAAAENELRSSGGQRVIWLSDYVPADGAVALPPNQFLAVRKQDGTHGFYGSNEL